MRPSGGKVPELILDRAPSAVISLDERGFVTYWNRSAEDAFRVPREHAIGRELADLIIPERYRAAHRDGIKRFLSEGTGPLLERPTELTALRADGTEFPVELTVSAIRRGSAWTFTAFVDDLSERDAAERERERLVGGLRRAHPRPPRAAAFLRGRRALGCPVGQRWRERGGRLRRRRGLRP